MVHFEMFFSTYYIPSENVSYSSDIIHFAKNCCRAHVYLCAGKTHVCFVVWDTIGFVAVRVTHTLISCRGLLLPSIGTWARWLRSFVRVTTVGSWWLGSAEDRTRVSWTQDDSFSFERKGDPVALSNRLILVTFGDGSHQSVIRFFN